MSQNIPDAPRIRLSAVAGEDPVWSADGTHIFFHNVREVYKVRVSRAGESTRYDQELLFSGDFVDLPGTGWAVDDDRGVFYMARSVETATTANRLNVITNFQHVVTAFDPAKR